MLAEVRSLWLVPILLAEIPQTANHEPLGDYPVIDKTASELNAVKPAELGIQKRQLCHIERYKMQH